MPGKQRYIRSIDIPMAGAFDAGSDPSSTAALAPPVQATIGPPTNLTLTTAIERNAVTPTARIGATWYPPSGVAPSSYVVQWSTSSSFPDPGTNGQGAGTEATTIGGLNVATLYYVRVQAVVTNVQGDWSATASMTTASDTTPPNPVSGQAASFQGAGDLVITWTNPSSANFRDVEIGIYSDSAKTTTYATLYDATGRRVWTAAENLAATSGAGDPTVYVELRARSWSGIFSTAVNTGTVTKAPPAAPAVSVDFSGPDAVYTITPPADAVQISFVANTGITARAIGVVGRLVYTFDQNRLDNTTPDPTLAYSFTAIDGLKQSSTATTGTATNAAPATTAIAIFGGYSTIGVSITASAAADVRDYTVRIILNGSTAATYTTTSLNQIYSATASGSYQAGVKVNDVFGQASSETVSSAVVIDAITIAELRANGTYTDDLGTVSATLDTLKDANIASGGVTTASGIATAWHWYLFTRTQIDRYRTITIAASAGVGYIGVSIDNTTYTWFSGPLAADGRTLTAVANEAAAQAAAINLPSSGGVHRWELPTMQEARYIKLGHRNTVAVAYTTYEFYPRRLVEGDDIRGESITGINVAASSITADKISVTQLSALAADMGTITAGTITGATIQTATSGARVVLSSAAFGGLIGYSSSDTYNPATGSGTYQVFWSKADGKLYGGGGVVVLDSGGVAVQVGASYLDTQSYRLIQSGGTTFGGLGGTYTAGSGHSVELRSRSLTGEGSNLFVYAQAPNAKPATVYVQVNSGLVNFPAITASTDGSTHAVVIDALNTSGTIRLTSPTTITQGLNLGSATGAAAGQIRIDNSSYQIYWDSGNTAYATSANWVVGGNIYWGTGGNFLSAYLNQTVLTSSSPTFAGASIRSGSSGTFATAAVGRTADEGRLAIAASAGQFAAGAVAGDLIVRVDSSSQKVLFAAGGTEILTISASNVGIGSAPGTVNRLLILGVDNGSTNRVASFRNSSNTDLMYIRNDGQTWANQAWTISDARVKENIRNLRYGLESIMRLRPVMFDRIGGDRDQIGFIAQDVAEVIPELVALEVGDAETHALPHLGLQLTGILPILVRAIQQLAEKVAQLERNAHV